MTRKFIMSRLGGSAIAAVLALTASPAFAQEATPQKVPQATEPVATPDPLAAAPTTTDPLAADAASQSEKGATIPPVTTTDEAAAATTATTSTKRASTSSTVKRPSSTSSSKTEAAPVVPASAATVAYDPVIDPAIPVAPLAVQPPAPVAAEPLAATDPANDDAVPLALGAGLGLLALGGAAFALRRRRSDRVDDDLIVTEPTLARAAAVPAESMPAAANRSAFQWGNAPVTAAPIGSTTHGKNWVDRAHEGPSPENPSLSLKKRLQRAAFYDRRDREVAAGRATPLSPMAGLPSRFVDTFRKRTSATAPRFSYAPA